MTRCEEYLSQNIQTRYEDTVSHTIQTRGEDTVSHTQHTDMLRRHSHIHIIQTRCEDTVSHTRQVGKTWCHASYKHVVKTQCKVIDTL